MEPHIAEFAGFHLWAGKRVLEIGCGIGSDAEEFAKANRPDKAAEEKAEGEVIAKYLPAQLSEDDIKKMIAAAVASTGAAGPGDMGKVMGAIKPQIAGKADGALVSSLVKAALAN